MTKALRSPKERCGDDDRPDSASAVALLLVRSGFLVGEESGGTSESIGKVDRKQLVSRLPGEVDASLVEIQLGGKMTDSQRKVR